MTDPHEHDMRRFSSLLSQNARQWRRSINEELRPQGLTEATWLPLLHLARADGPMLQKALAQAMTLDSSSVVRLLDGLEAAGLVERTATDDRRAKAIRLTDAGRAVVVDVERVVDDARRRYLADIGAEELAVALRVLEKVSAALSPAAAVQELVG
ncbi:MarR family winged helix-turn-helix transcriptional regulator [Xylophilus sp. GOD-11R]|uniref:MarR family winged helix-turn-helix transcriptional regulator n=1 Tax=Xylophilus sp. GOD-11R TaxID=3089814 RepID=UPI00298BDCA2|nr:MarR family transcriptional regulator [Xylophilus sp. GOD-11R]WPB56430.1 MarR family transcriptional regulator [Xylophilus sp. GOD-11R]